MEVDVGIICSCLMLLPAFLKHHLPESCKSFLSLSLSRITASFSGMSGMKSSERSTKNTWPKDKYHSIGKSHGSMIQAHSTGPPSEASIEMHDPPEWVQVSNVQSAYVRSPV